MTATGVEEGTTDSIQGDEFRLGRARPIRRPLSSDLRASVVRADSRVTCRMNQSLTIRSGSKKTWHRDHASLAHNDSFVDVLGFYSLLTIRNIYLRSYRDNRQIGSTSGGNTSGLASWSLMAPISGL
jgi:hypothetical protein